MESSEEHQGYSGASASSLDEEVTTTARSWLRRCCLPPQKEKGQKSKTQQQQEAGGGLLPSLQRLLRLYWAALVLWLLGVRAAVAMSIWVGSLFLSTALTLAGLLFLPHPLAIAALVLQGTLAVLPLEGRPTPWWADKLCSYAVETAAAYFPVRVVVEDAEALRPGRPYVVGYEPHSALPTGLPVVFSTYSRLLPPGLAGTKILASSIVFRVPGVRQLWWWLGIRPVSRLMMSRLLSRGEPVVLCPGGVQECLYMQHGSNEVAFLTQRTGFIKLAIQHGAPVVPCFAFGQTATYDWWRPGPPLLSRGAVERVARLLGFLPLALVGAYGTPMPKRVPLTVVLGRPVEVLHDPQPSPELVRERLDAFIAALRELFERHKAAAGYAPGAALHVL